VWGVGGGVWGAGPPPPTPNPQSPIPNPQKLIYILNYFFIYGIDKYKK